MHALITGASGTVGRFITERLLQDGREVTVLGRKPLEGFHSDFLPFDLRQPVGALPEADALIHCALLHEPGRFRGGEGDDPEGFLQANVEGSRNLFEAARRAGCKQTVFLSTRAVYGDDRRGEVLLETDEPVPGTLYGQVKQAGEEILRGLAGSGFQASVLRATGVYGLTPGLGTHKWQDLFASFLSGEEIAPRRATEVHGADLAEAVALLLEQRDGLRPFEIFNVSDLLLDRRDLLARLEARLQSGQSLPDVGSDKPGVMDTTHLQALGWRPGGTSRLDDFLDEAAVKLRGQLNRSH